MTTRLQVERQIAAEEVLQARWHLEQAERRLANLDAAIALTRPPQ